MNNPYVHALEFLVDAGVTVALMDEPHDRFSANTNITAQPEPSIESQKPQQKQVSQQTIQPHADVIAEAQKIANACSTLEDLKDTITGFDGLGLKKTATNIAFADGNAQADIIVIGDAPNKEDDRNGKVFTDIDGALLNKILASIGLDREKTYLTNIINWRPPGGRTPTEEEISIATPFLKKHIDLIKPKYIICLGGVPAQILLDRKESISRLRGQIHDYGDGIKLIATYHPLSLLKTPLQKKKVWQDMLMFKGLIND